MAGSQIATSVTIINSLLGFQAVSLTNLSSSAATVITAGSKVEIAGGFFTFSTPETPDGASWTSIATGSAAYLRLTPTGIAGAQTVTADWSTAAPVWDDAKQGWYYSGSSIRYIGGAYKGGATSYLNKYLNSEATGSKVEIGALTLHSFHFTSANDENDVFDTINAVIPAALIYRCIGLYGGTEPIARVNKAGGGIEFYEADDTLVLLCQDGDTTNLTGVLDVIIMV